jgi:hypothetical protein
MNKHEEHQKKGIVYQATCEECQKEQLGKFAKNTIQAARDWSIGRYPDGVPLESFGHKVPKRHGCI